MVVCLGLDGFDLTIGSAMFRCGVAISMMNGLSGCSDLDVDERIGLFYQVG